MKTLGLADSSPNSIWSTLPKGLDGYHVRLASIYVDTKAKWITDALDSLGVTSYEQAVKNSEDQQPFHIRPHQMQELGEPVRCNNGY